MIYLVTGSSHTGKTMLAQCLLEKFSYPYLSIDHLKMGLIRSGYCTLSPEDSDEALSSYLWPVVREMIKTAIENRQNLIVEGCYVPFDWKQGFAEAYLREIKFICLVFSPRYIKEHTAEIHGFENRIEFRGEGADSLSVEYLLAENVKNLELCKKHDLAYYLTDTEYSPAAMQDAVAAL